MEQGVPWRLHLPPQRLRMGISQTLLKAWTKPKNRHQQAISRGLSRMLFDGPSPSTLARWNDDGHLPYGRRAKSQLPVRRGNTLTDPHLRPQILDSSIYSSRNVDIGYVWEEAITNGGEGKGKRK